MNQSLPFPFHQSIKKNKLFNSGSSLINAPQADKLKATMMEWSQ